VLLIATDVALVDEAAEYAEPATGSGAVAMLLAADPRVLAVDVGAFGAYSFEVLDSARPTPDLDVVDIDRSLVAYLTCLERSFDDYRSRVADVDVTKTFDFLALHTPFAGMARAAHRKLMREFGDATDRAVAEDFAARVAPSLEYPALVGNLFSGSLYLALASLVDHAPIDGTARVGLFSYGSGCSAEFFSGLVGPAAKAALARMRIGAHLAGRAELTFDEYRDLVPEHKRCLVPDRYREVDLARWRPFVERATSPGPLLALRRIDNYHREYEWT
jgi:polyketide biosynthesis 3-hydroxy-3-methylglutaryl-CoA synthase-like enzyme PksG